MKTSLQMALCLLMLGSAAQADNWTMTMTVDNEYDVYFGTNMVTNLHAGGDNNWFTVETWNATNVAPTDFLYVATASDHSVAQGFLGTFTNTTTNTVVYTGAPAWEVFPAGKYLQQINSNWPPTWPASQQPTQSEVDQAIAFATSGNHWISTSQLAGWNNAGHPGPWGHNLPGIAGTAMWIWHDSGTYTSGSYPAPYGGWNHDEFLVFRIPGIAPEPGALALLALAGLTGLRRWR
ncbi:MAG: hypothetical protein AB1716_05630 [Planctomycetota bacterium]